MDLEDIDPKRFGVYSFSSECPSSEEVINRAKKYSQNKCTSKKQTLNILEQIIERLKKKNEKT